MNNKEMVDKLNLFKHRGKDNWDYDQDRERFCFELGLFVVQLNHFEAEAVIEKYERLLAHYKAISLDYINAEGENAEKLFQELKRVEVLLGDALFG